MLYCCAELLLSLEQVWFVFFFFFFFFKLQWWDFCIYDPISDYDPLN